MMYGTNGKLREELYLKDRLHITLEAYRMIADKLEPLLISLSSTYKCNFLGADNKQ